MRRDSETYDFEKGVLSSMCDKKTVAKLQRVSVIDVLDVKGNVVLVFRKVEA